MKDRQCTIGLISSRGGHLYQLFLLKPIWGKYRHFWITGKGEDSDYLLAGEQVYHGYFPVTRHALHAILNLLLAVRILLNERPRVLISCGAGIAPPFFLIGKLLGCKLIFVDSFTFIRYPSLSARLCSFMADHTLTQHRGIAKQYPGLEYWGDLL